MRWGLVQLFDATHISGPGSIRVISIRRWSKSRNVEEAAKYRSVPRGDECLILTKSGDTYSSCGRSARHFVWATGHMPEHIPMPYMFTLVTEAIWYLAIATIALRMVMTILLFIIDAPGEDRLGGADRILRWIGPKKP